MGTKPKYINKKEIKYYSKRYDKHVTVPKWRGSDGATGAFDIDSISWWVHDELCLTGIFDDGTPCTNWQASTILSDILKSEKRYFRMLYWWPFTFLLGGGKCRERMFK